MYACTYVSYTHAYTQRHDLHTDVLKIPTYTHAYVHTNAIRCASDNSSLRWDPSNNKGLNKSMMLRVVQAPTLLRPRHPAPQKRTEAPATVTAATSGVSVSCHSLSTLWRLLLAGGTYVWGCSADVLGSGLNQDLRLVLLFVHARAGRLNYGLHRCSCLPAAGSRMNVFDGQMLDFT